MIYPPPGQSNDFFQNKAESNCVSGQRPVILVHLVVFQKLLLLFRQIFLLSWTFPFIFTFLAVGEAVTDLVQWKTLAFGAAEGLPFT